MGKKKKKSAGKSGSGKNAQNGQNSQESLGGADGSSSAAAKPVIKKVAEKPKEPPKGLNKIPYWLRHEKGLSDFVAGGIVLIGAGLLIVIICSVLVLVWPAG